MKSIKLQPMMFRSRTRCDAFKQHRYISFERATMWKTNIQRILLTFLTFYTLLYLIVINGIYVTNQGHKTSIDIRVHQINTRADHTNDKTRQHTSHIFDELQESSQLPTDEANANYIEETNDTSFEERNDYERSADDDDDFEQSFDEEKDDLNDHINHKRHKKPFFYDHPVLRRIEGKPVYYISAIAEENAWSDKRSPIYDGDFQVGKPYSNVSHSKNNIRHTRKRRSNSRYRTFLQPLAYESNNRSVGGTITLNGWESYKHSKARYYCCFKYGSTITSNSVREMDNRKGNKRNTKAKNKRRHQSHKKDNTVTKSSLMVWKNIWNMHEFKIIKAAQFVCPLLKMGGDDLETTGRDGDQHILPTHVALSDKENCKNEELLKFIDIERVTPRWRDDAIALCPKLVYGNYSADRLIEWFEFNKHMGVDKIMLFTYNVVDDIKVVLQHYEQEGLLIIREFDIPAKTTFKRKPGGKNMMAYQDEQVTVFDCIERFNGFRFVAVLDLDEFLVPADAVNGDATWRTMLNQLQNINPNASGFVFHTQIFTLDWGVSNPRGKFFVTKHIQRTSTMWDRKKNIIIPERVRRGMVWTHAYTSALGYTPVKVQSKVANIFHYRNCRPHWIQSHTCMKGRPKIMDKTMVLVMTRIEKNVLAMKNKLVRS